MDKEVKVKISDDAISTAVEDHTHNKQDDENNEAVVIKKSSGGLSLLLSLLALAGVAYLLYTDWRAVDQGAKDSVSHTTIQQLQDSDQVLSTDLQNAQVDLNQLKQQTSQIKAIEQQLKQQTEQLASIEIAQQNSHSGLPTSGIQFDNSSNEQALTRLQQQLTDQAQTISGMQSAAAKVLGTQDIAHDVLSENYDQIEKNAAIQVLLTTDVLLATHRLPQAIIGLDNYLNISGLKSVDKSKLMALLNQLQQIDQPDVEQISQQLQALKSAVDALQVTTETTASDETKWYERFVSVKKIATDNTISSTAQMVTFKTELNRLLYQAKLYLMLKDQTGWKNSLEAANQWIKNEAPEQAELAGQIMDLANQAVVAKLPNQLNVSDVINELQGLR